MVSRKDIKAYADSMVSYFSPARVVLFGSYSKGTPNEDSDGDMLVIPHAGVITAAAPA